MDHKKLPSVNMSIEVWKLGSIHFGQFAHLTLSYSWGIVVWTSLQIQGSSSQRYIFEVIVNSATYVLKHPRYHGRRVPSAMVPSTVQSAPAIELGPHREVVLIFYYSVLVLGAQVGLPLVLATAFFGRNQTRRHPAFINIVIAWLVYGIGALFLWVTWKFCILMILPLSIVI